MLSAMGGVFLIFNYLRYHYYEICSQFMKIQWNSPTAAFVSNDCNRKFTVYFETNRISSKNEKYSFIAKKKDALVTSNAFTRTIKICNHHRKRNVSYKYFERELTVKIIWSCPRTESAYLMAACLVNSCPKLLLKYFL